MSVPTSLERTAEVPRRPLDDTAGGEEKALRSVDRALEILCYFLTQDEAGISDLSRRLSLSKGAVHRMVGTLASRGFLEKTEKGRFRLGLRVLELGNAYRSRMDLIRVAEPIARQLMQTLHMSVHLAHLDGASPEVVDIVRVEGPVPVRAARFAILRRPAYCTALGKVLLAHERPEVLDQVIAAGLHRLTARTIATPQRLTEELQRIRRIGYAVDDEEFSSGIRCVAAPVRDETGAVIAALSVSTLITRLTRDQVPKVVEIVRAAADEISAHLGWSVRVVGDSGIRS